METTIHISDDDVLSAMSRYGGGFVSHLAAAWRRADGDNDAKLKAAFPEYWEQYKEMAISDRLREMKQFER